MLGHSSDVKQTKYVSNNGFGIIKFVGFSLHPFVGEEKKNLEFYNLDLSASLYRTDGETMYMK